MGQEIFNLEFYSFSPTFDDPPAGKSSKSRRSDGPGSNARSEEETCRFGKPVDPS